MYIVTHSVHVHIYVHTHTIIKSYFKQDYGKALHGGACPALLAPEKQGDCRFEASLGYAVRC